MKYLISFLLVFTCTYAHAQEPTYVPMKSNYFYKGIKMDSLFILPNIDTSGARKVNGNIVRQGDAYYWYDSTAWKPIVTGGGGATDTTSLSNRINQKVDSVTRKSDSVKYWKTGIAYFAFKDSVQNGTFGDDTALVILAKVHNSTGTLLTRGTVVMLNGATGDVASVIRANNKNDTTSARTIGVVKDNIAIGGTGYVVTQGQASGLNLGAFTAGDVLYLDSIDGGLTKTKPVAPYHNVFIGIVERANNGNGLLYVKPLNGFELDELHTVRITSPVNNQVLAYSDTQQLWKNRNIYTIVDTLGLSNRINAKLNISDTSSMLTNYQRTSSFPIAVFGAGSGASGDTSAFTTSTIYGSFYLNAGSDTIIVTGYTAVVQGTSASVTPTIWFNDSLNVTAGATKIVNSPSAVTSTTTGNTVTALNNTKIPPGNFVWVSTGTVTTKPNYFNLTLIGYRKR